MPPFFTKFSEILRKNQNKPAICSQIIGKLKRKSLIYSKIKFLFFLLKSVAFIKKVLYLQCQTTTTTKQRTMKNTAIDTAIEMIQDNQCGILSKMQEIAYQQGMTAEQWTDFKCFTAAALAFMAVKKSSK